MTTTTVSTSTRRRRRTVNWPMRVNMVVCLRSYIYARQRESGHTGAQPPRPRRTPAGRSGRCRRRPDRRDRFGRRGQPAGRGQAGRRLADGRLQPLRRQGRPAGGRRRALLGRVPGGHRRHPRRTRAVGPATGGGGRLRPLRPRAPRPVRGHVLRHPQPARAGRAHRHERLRHAGGHGGRHPRRQPRRTGPRVRRRPGPHLDPRHGQPVGLRPRRPLALDRRPAWTTSWSASASAPRPPDATRTVSPCRARASGR